MSRKTDKIHSTAFLDALRGYAACVVFAGHLLGYPAAIQYPFIRILTSNRGMVDLFFVISGYVLSFRMLKMMRQRDAGNFLQTLASSTFRRFLRLYVPTGIATFIAMLGVYMGRIPTAAKLATFQLQLWDWIIDTFFASSPFADLKGWWYPGLFRTKYLDQMWTIPVEFRGSMVLFTFCAASCKLSVRGRMIFTWIAILACYCWNVIYVALFLLGLFVAELSLEWSKAARQVQHHNRLEFPTARRRLARSGVPNAMLVCIFVFSLFLLSQPHEPGFGSDGPFPWQYLTRLTPSWYGGPGEPKEHFWLSIGAFLLVFSLEFYPVLQTPLRWKFSLYLGDLSFGLYAMHPIVIWVLYLPILEPYSLVYIGSSGWARIPAVVITAFVVLWVADYFERIDRRVVQLGRWLQGRTFVNWEL
ncbi:uncharacterized protein A1O9_10497 [Exophiala aquamarina CBS 119918]|uniref:Acyltransferase 3 domain-containing protein n=1 Tax=Exophiala aquamarina CBS 119918 TaxID=1182545 RepID=A0A072P1G3_9EURO|nr:uncharacterized protein A1O9_10497 [Exophiala aquamarina CBS 119918]KEF53522.1 hypothetical protein A1O9_10497 [Exophiala aquamarina CBS 119918]